MEFFVEELTSRSETSDIEKARAHKYVKRTGSPGSYRYWYKAADGSLKADDHMQDSGRIDHVKRLLSGRRGGHNSKSHAEIASDTGHPIEKIRSLDSNLATTARRGSHHGYELHHMEESNHSDISHSSYEHFATRGAESALAGRTPATGPALATTPATPARPRRPRRSRGMAALEPEAAGDTGITATRSAGMRAASPSPLPASTHRDEPNINSIRNHPVSAPAPSEAPARTLTALEAHHEAVDATTARRAAKAKAEEIKSLREMLKNDHGVDLSPSVAPPPAIVTPQVPGGGARDMRDPSEAPSSASVAEAARERSRAEASRVQAATPAESRPSTPAARALSSDDADFAASEAEITIAIADQSAGGNPYIGRAQEIFSHIKADLKEDRKKAVDHFFQSVEAVKASGQTPNLENILAHFKTLPGNERKRSLPKEDVERGTFHTIEELVSNPPINAEVERMKRGYAAKQYNRCKPFLKAAWLAANPEGPPPQPTWGDFMSWSEHVGLGGVKPEWAGTTKIAVPEEVYKASHIAADGKPKYPPAWMPLHMTPVWTYTAKSMERDQGSAAWDSASGSAPAYAATNRPTRNQSSPTGWSASHFGSQAVFQEGMIVSSIRKYVEMRGGVNNLTDIPSSKLSSLGITHADLFKSPHLTDEQVHTIIKHKIVDPVGLTTIIRKEMKKLKSEMIKSFSLTVDANQAYLPRKTFQNLKKSDPVSRIKEILSARSR